MSEDYNSVRVRADTTVGHTSQPTMMLRFENGRLHQQWLLTFTDGSLVYDWREVPTFSSAAREVQP
jgi:hypothetical protein